MPIIKENFLVLSLIWFQALIPKNKQKITTKVCNDPKLALKCANVGKKTIESLSHRHICMWNLYFFSQIIKNFTSNLFNSKWDLIKALHTLRLSCPAPKPDFFLYDFLLSLARNWLQSNAPTPTITLHINVK